MPLPKINPAYLAKLNPEDRAEVERELALLETLNEQDPLGTFEPNCDEQEKFIAATTPTQAAFCGNQAGKTTGLVVKSLIQVTPRDRLPERLRAYKRYDGQVFGRIVNPGAKQLKNTLLPAFRQWTPKHICKNGSFDSSWSTQDQTLTFNDGSFIDFLTYETDLDKFGGPQRHFLGYDEPPPREIRDEGLARLTRFGGFEMFAMTPLKANTGWVKRDIWRKREDARITVAKWSIHQNKALSKEAVKYFLDSLPTDMWRAAREYGDFVDMGGMMYPRFEDWVRKDLPVDPAEAMEALRERVSYCDIVVGIDPGYRNAAFVWAGFDRDGQEIVFAEELLQQKDASEYAGAIRAMNARWGLKGSEITYVIDPSYRVTGLAGHGENVESALSREGIYCVPGEHAVEAGVMEVNQRGNSKALEISPALVGLRDEADEYAMEDREDGQFKEKRNDNSHRLDALRYICMYRTWTHHDEHDEAPLGWTPGEMPALSALQGRQRQDTPPLGFMS
jgi:phage terminase large subunit-like protein